MPKRKRAVEDGVDSLPNGPAAGSGDQEPTPKRAQQRRSLFVHPLPPGTTTESLIEHFSQSFPIKHATAVTDPKTRLCKGYGFVTFADPEDAQRAHKEFDHSEFQGRKLRLEIAEPRHREVDDTLPEGLKTKSTSVKKPTEISSKQEERGGDQPGTKLIVRNLPWTIKKPEQLQRLFLSYGKVKQVSLPTKKPGLLSGFGFVTLRGRKNAEKALQGVNGMEVDGRTLAVDWAVEKELWRSQQQEQQQQQDLSLYGGDGFEGRSRDAESSDLKAEQGTDDDIASEEPLGNDEASDEHSDGHKIALEDQTATIFIRNLPFTTTDDEISDHFSQFGRLRYARIVLDQITEKPKGTAFVRFLNAEEALNCLKNAPKHQNPRDARPTKSSGPSGAGSQSLLQSEDDDPSGKYTIQGRVLQLSRAVDKSQAVRLSEENSSRRNDREMDKRRLYLLSEGTLTPDSPLRQSLSPSEIAMRESSTKQRKALIQSNPSLHLSLTRLSIRNIPRSVTSKVLKSLAREAVVGFAKDVKAGNRPRLSKEELARSDEATGQADRERKEKRKGVVKQAKVVFEGSEGGKVNEKTGAGRSRGYGFIEYHSHRSALMGLRWLNGHAVAYQAHEDEQGRAAPQSVKEKKKRLIVEFAIENAQVVTRRSEREVKARSKPMQGRLKGRSEKEDDDSSKTKAPAKMSEEDVKERDKQARRQRIIARKRAQRRGSRKGAS